MSLSALSTIIHDLTMLAQNTIKHNLSAVTMLVQSTIIHDLTMLVQAPSYTIILQ